MTNFKVVSIFFQQPSTECPVISAMPSSSIDLRTQSISVPSSGYVWPSGSRAQASTVPCSLSVRPQMDMNMAKLEEARLVLQAMDCRTTWKDDDGDTWVRETEWRDIFPFILFFHVQNDCRSASLSSVPCFDISLLKIKWWAKYQDFNE